MSESFGVSINDGLGIAIQSAYFVPRATGSHSFYVIGNCVSEVYMSHNADNPADEVTSSDPMLKVCHISNNV